MVDHYVQYVLHSEVRLTANVQELFKPFDWWLVGLREFCSPASLIDNVIPIIGLTDMRLMADMTSALGLLNTISSVVKWTFPQYRPNWWIREFEHKSIKLNQSSLFTCDTTAGFPSAHSMTFTGLMFILLLCLKMPTWTRWLAATFLSIPMWIACVYFGSHFLHQCIFGSFMAVFVIENIRQRKSAERAGVIFMESCRKAFAIAAVVAVGLFVIGMYFAMLYAGLDPHWSVRMAFKWCPDPQYLRHETSPIFIMCRDLGFMMGIALSSPFSKRVQKRLQPIKSIPAVILLMAVGFLARMHTPKNFGRFVFVGYEFIRNTLYSFTLLTVLPKLCKRNKQKLVE